MSSLLIVKAERFLLKKLLQKNQMKIGRRCAILQSALVRTALETAIKQACSLNIQQIAQVNYAQVDQTIKNTGLTSSISNNIYTKKDITNYINVPYCHVFHLIFLLVTLNNPLYILHVFYWLLYLFLEFLKD